MSMLSSKRLLLEVVSDSATRYNFDIISKQLQQIQASIRSVNYVSSEETPAGTLTTSLYPVYEAIQPLVTPITTFGNPVWLALQPRIGDADFLGSVQISSIALTTTLAYLRFYRDGTLIYETTFGYSDTTAASTRSSFHAPSEFWTLDRDVNAGSHQYACKAAVAATGQTLFFNLVRLTALEIQGISPVSG